MRVLVTGISGQLGYDVVEVGERIRAKMEVEAKERGVEPSGRVSEIVGLDRAACNVSSMSSVMRAVYEVQPDVIVHAGAYTKVDLAEAEGRLEAYAVNAYGTRAMAQAAAEVGARLVYVSTDYVFDGTKGSAYTEWDEPAPLNEYGRSKLAGEQFVRAFVRNHYIVRTSWVYGAHTGLQGGNFVKAMLQLAQTQMQERADGRAELSVVADQVGSPTWSRDLADGIWRLLLADADSVEPTSTYGRYGTYHMSGKGSCSWYEFAQAIFAECGLSDCVTIRPITTDEFPRKARRPALSLLEPLALEAQGMLGLRDWREALHDFMEEYDRPQ